MELLEGHSPAHLKGSLDAQHLGEQFFTPTATPLRYPLQTAKTQKFIMLYLTPEIHASVLWDEEIQTDFGVNSTVTHWRNVGELIVIKLWL